MRIIAWLTSTARALDEGRWREVDAAQVAEELRDMGKSERRAIESLLEVILVHILKICYQGDRRSRSWDLSIANSRLRLKKLLSENPSLAARTNELITDVYESARIEAASQTDMPLEVFPAECAYTVGDIMERDWSASDLKSH